VAQEVVPQRAVLEGKWGSGLVQDKAWDRVALPAVAVGVLAVSASAIFIRLAEAPAVAIAFWRCALWVAVLLPPALIRKDSFPKGRALYAGIASGVALGAHFGFWISSLDYTSVAASVVLVSTQPVFVAVLAYLLFGEITTPLSFLGILVALAGTAVIAFDKTIGSAAFFGNVLALIGAVTVAVYVLIGRSSRTGGVGVLPYSIVVYSAAAATLLPVALILDVRLWGYTGETWFWLAAITAGPQLLGHTVFNWALRYVEASVISGTILAEPVVAAFLAWLVLSERPGLLTVVGGAVVLAGLYFLLKGRSSAGYSDS
jgi:drug/metabolite transporter (DMT)-like permease